jgi:hypothetical protein
MNNNPRLLRITLMGIRGHALYWGDILGAESVYSVLLPQMYGGSQVLE